ncbi:MAG: ATP-binding cassette domain-containing protein [Clostridiaceae bacterium]|nr:ATP-binding cassette domain-containing protein [Clostridiaceae bacterium]
MELSSNGIHCLFGPSGCGKTTLLNILAGLSTADQGDIKGIENKTFSYIFQEDRLLPWATVEENIFLILTDSYSKREAQGLMDKYLDLVDLSKFKNYYPEALSGGMRQRVSIARAFAYEGDILLMDEPFKGLHMELKKTLMDYLISYWHQKKQLFLFVTHDVEEALYMADHIHIFQGPPMELTKKLTIDIPAGDARNKNEKIDQFKEMLVHSNKGKLRL